MKVFLRSEHTDAQHVQMGQVFRGSHTDYLIKVEPYDDMVLAYELKTGKQVKLEQKEHVEVYPDATLRSI